MLAPGHIHAHRTFIANALLEHKTQQAEPRFLNRNLRVILDAHERQLAAQQRSRPADPSSASAHAAPFSSRDRMFASDRRPSGWNFPTPEMSQDLIRGDLPVLQIDRLQLRKSDATATMTPAPEFRASSESERDSPDWLPDVTGKTFHMPVRVSVQVFDTRSSKRSILVDTRHGRMVESRQGVARGAYDVYLEEPFAIELYKLFVVTETGTNGARHWKRTITANYALDVCIQPQDSDENPRFLSELEGIDVREYKTVLSSEALVKASWNSLPQCPARGQSLSLRRARGHKVVEMTYQLELSMGWNRREESVLARYNRLCYRRSPPPALLPTPSASEDPEAMPQIIVLYKHRDGLDTRTLLVHGLECPFCETGVQHSSFDRLHLHFLTRHESFTVDVDDEPDHTDDDTMRRIVLISSNESSTTQQPKFDEGWSWTAPDEPFDLKAELRGQRKYLAAGRPFKIDGRRRGFRKNHDRITGTGSLVPPVSSRPEPDKVEDIPVPSQTKHMVPIVPDVRFYHSTSKQVLSGGEYIADDDEMTSHPWQRQMHDAALERCGLQGSAKDFHSAWDAHFAREQAGSAILTNEALVRFNRQHDPASKPPRWRSEFLRKLELLDAHGIIKQTTYDYVLRGAEDWAMMAVGDQEMVDGEMSDHSPSDSALGQDSHPRREDEASMDATAPQESSYTKTSLVYAVDNASKQDHTFVRPANQRLSSTCLCGQVAVGVRGTLACHNPHCSSGTFHLACVGLDRRLPGWTCPNCSKSPLIRSDLFAHNSWGVEPSALAT